MVNLGGKSELTGKHEVNLMVNLGGKSGKHKVNPEVSLEGTPNAYLAPPFSTVSSNKQT